MTLHPSRYRNGAIAAAQPTPVIDPETVDPAPIRIALPGLHLAGSNAHYNAHLEVGRHGLALFLSPTAPFPTLDIDGTREELAEMAHALSGALSDWR